MRTKRLSISDMTERVTIHIPTGERDAIGGYVQSETELKEVWANVTSKLKDRVTTEGGIKYFREYDVKIRPVQMEKTDFITIRGEKCAVQAMEETTHYIRFKALNA